MLSWRFSKKKKQRFWTTLLLNLPPNPLKNVYILFLSSRNLWLGISNPSFCKLMSSRGHVSKQTNLWFMLALTVSILGQCWRGIAIQLNKGVKGQTFSGTFCGIVRSYRLVYYRGRRNYYSINSQELHGCNAAHYSLVINSSELQDCNCNCNAN